MIRPCPKLPCTKSSGNHQVFLTCFDSLRNSDCVSTIMFSTKTSAPTGMMTISPAPAPENTPASIPTVLADVCEASLLQAEPVGDRNTILTSRS
ncbi:uncharacterized protein EI90DRAFT_2519940 [Cantharellus anzutake]|uniref:uncharacterized protein n=1 Tax=Cantharellus anzutake TaxID=1750568 RepID=UPI0019054046|nr:uncharacterized protein EI90DRAFT_2519940 [Cantharellus anzutake]KAF8337896.1 hypothetical protein EI90DRAFT_2519940 [Cantharellus anzutake]